MYAWYLKSWWNRLFSSSYPNALAWQMIQSSCCFLLQTIIIPGGEIWEIYDIYRNLNSPSVCTFWGCKMDLLRNSPFLLLFHLPSPPCSMPLWGARSPIHIFSTAALQNQRGGPRRVNSVSSSISHSSDCQSEIPRVSWGQNYRQQLLP